MEKDEAKNQKYWDGKPIAGGSMRRLKIGKYVFELYAIFKIEDSPPQNKPLGPKTEVS
jgi:hypothetical protein